MVEVAEQEKEPVVRIAKGATLIERLDALLISEGWLEEAGGELTPEVEALLNEAKEDFAEKVERVALKVKALENDAAAITKEADRLYARAKSRATAAKSLKSYLQLCLERAGETKVTGLLCTVALQKNPPSLKTPALTQDDLRELHEAGFGFVRVVPESCVLEKRELIAHAKTSPAVLPTGWELEQGQSLRIR
jgi:polynucleotide 5'-kinase involved in rRNA processing